MEDTGQALPLDVAFVVREGRDVTLVSWGAMVKDTLEAADELAADGIDAEVIDLATLKPYDEQTVLDLVAKTGRCVIVPIHWMNHREYSQNSKDLLPVRNNLQARLFPYPGCAYSFFQ